MSNISAWSTPTTYDEVCRRAGGRRRYNAVRQFLAILRRKRVLDLLRRYGVRRGVQTRIARELGVNRATICRDLKALLPEQPPCPTCDRPVPYISPKMAREVLRR